MSQKLEIEMKSPEETKKSIYTKESLHKKGRRPKKQVCQLNFFIKCHNYDVSPKFSKIKTIYATRRDNINDLEPVTSNAWKMLLDKYHMAQGRDKEFSELQ